ncbi:hypothetical protein QR680_011643 [Steinernema hermaphroditum]|uniref:Uncharacterized protein n=1 Tax=Steinernema hermaphroditum TaxID=289476 RepID=A0AA39LZC6_9BILA|nr:hypothetical protein QR680_011643 [Steinernema hermaphroditum]
MVNSLKAVMILDIFAVPSCKNCGIHDFAKEQLANPVLSEHPKLTDVPGVELPEIPLEVATHTTATTTTATVIPPLSISVLPLEAKQVKPNAACPPAVTSDCTVTKPDSPPANIEHPKIEPSVRSSSILLTEPSYPSIPRPEATWTALNRTTVARFVGVDKRVVEKPFMSSSPSVFPIIIPISLTALYLY